MEEVLGDRCIQIILEKSDNKKKIDLIENWEDLFPVETIIKDIRLTEQCSLCSLVSP